MYMISLGNEAQHGLTIIECDLFFHSMVLHKKYTPLMSQKQKIFYHLESVQNLSFSWLNHTKIKFSFIFCVKSNI